MRKLNIAKELAYSFPLQAQALHLDSSQKKYRIQFKKMGWLILPINGSEYQDAVDINDEVNLMSVVTLYKLHAFQ